MDIKSYLENKKILILGFGREGQSTYEWLRKLLPEKELTIGDNHNEGVHTYFSEKQDSLVAIQTGENYLSDPQFDLVIKSPGIPYKSIRHIYPMEVISSQSQLFLQAFGKRVIGITGTKGKSTTSSLIYEVLKAYGYPVKLVGNIGIPPMSQFFEDTGVEIYVYEMSSHMLETVSVSPHISLVTNVFQEHLDHYDSYQAYIDSKANIIKFQSEDDFAILFQDNQIIQDQFMGYRGAISLFSASQSCEKGVWLDGKDIVVKVDGLEKIYAMDFPRKIKGFHNLINCLGVIAVLVNLGIKDFDLAFKVMGEYPGLPHRLAFAGNYRNRVFYNDSISTIPETTIAGIKALETVDCVILGGMDRAVDYEPLVEAIIAHPVREVILMYATGKRLEELFLAKLKANDSIHIHQVDDLKEGVQIAFQVTKPFECCLFSPAAASYGYFKDFADRGNYFLSLLEKETEAALTE